MRHCKPRSKKRKHNFAEAQQPSKRLKHCGNSPRMETAANFNQEEREQPGTVKKSPQPRIVANFGQQEGDKWLKAEKWINNSFKTYNGDKDISLVIIDFFSQKCPKLDLESKPISEVIFKSFEKKARIRAKGLQALSRLTLNRRYDRQKERVQDGLLGAFWYSIVLRHEHSFEQVFLGPKYWRIPEKGQLQKFTEFLFHSLDVQPSRGFDFAAGYELVRCWERYMHIANAVDWNTLTLLLHSPQFQEQVHCFDDVRWKAVVDAVKKRRISIKLAGYDCFPEWRNTFQAALPWNETLLIQDEFPTTWNDDTRYKYRCGDGKLESIPQKYEYITRCQPRSHDTRMPQDPDQSPEFLPRPDYWKCTTCKHLRCICGWEYINPIRVEMFTSGTNLGELSTGLRTLQAVSTGTIIGNYTGENIHDDELEEGDYYAMKIIEAINLQSYSVSAVRKGVPNPAHLYAATSLYNTTWYIGSIISAWATYGTLRINNTWFWRIPSVLQAAPALIMFRCIWGVPESPRWLIFRYCEDEVRKILSDYHTNGNDQDKLVQVEFTEVKEVIALESTVVFRSFGQPGETDNACSFASLRVASLSYPETLSCPTTPPISWDRSELPIQKLKISSTNVS
ncbi:hypothetical protein BDD12DRAFT_885166 [Trichophaea hybrida]|nr:hypothetical protein BDD12DRAFT_885166 [Trichophaea hybrida]